MSEGLIYIILMVARVKVNTISSNINSVNLETFVHSITVTLYERF
jgi:hypothetical protein